MRALQQYMNTLEQRGKKGRRSADEDTPRRDESVRAAKAQRRSAAEAAKSRAAAGDDFDNNVCTVKRSKSDRWNGGQAL